MPLTAFDTRRDNLRNFIRDKFDGNRSAFARAAGVSPNHVILLMSDNPELRRNLGEALSRRIENTLVLPAGYFDIVRGVGERAAHKMSAMEVPDVLRHIFATDSMIESASYYSSFLATLAGKITAPDNLSICQIVTSDMAPELIPGDQVFLDKGVRAVSTDGIYILGRDKDLFLRRVTKQLNGGWVISSPTDQPIKVESLKGLNVAGRIVMSWRGTSL